MLFNRTSLLNKMLVAFFAIIFGLTGILGFSSYWIAAKIVEKEITAARMTTLSFVSDKLDLLTDEIMSLADLIYLNKDTQNALKAADEAEQVKSEYEIKELLSNYRFMFKSVKYRTDIYSIKNTYHFSLGSSELAPSLYLPAETVKSKPWFEELITQQSRYFWLAGNEVTETAPLSFFALARPLNDLSAYQMSGLLVMSFHTDLLYQLYQNALGGDSPILLLTEKGLLISSSSDEITAGSMDLSALSEQFRGNVSGHFVSVLNEKKSLILFRHNEKTGWYIVQSVPLPLLLQFQQSIKVWIFVVSVICSLIAILLALLLSKKIYRPIYKIKDSMKIVETGNLSVPALDIARNDEIGVLNRGFVRMIEEIHVLMNRLIAEEKKKRELELSSLYSQINHHFLYNTLSTIRGTIYLGKTESANEMIISLVKLLKRTWNAKEELITIEDEIENLRHYVRIQTHRFQNFQVAFEVGEGLSQMKMLKMMIQPLLENAIFHGIKPKEEGSGTIIVRILLREDHLTVEVADNGVGIPDDIRSRLLIDSHTGTGIGVRNVHERIQIHYGSRYGVDVWSEEGAGTTITLTLPVLT